MAPHNPKTKEEGDTASDGLSGSIRNSDLEEALSVAGSKSETPTSPWDGPQDPKNPRNWPKWKKMTIVCMISAIGLETPMSSSICAPAISQITSEFHTTNEVLSSFIVSIYVLGFAVGPVLFGPGSEVWGRSIVYHICNIIVVGTTIGCALSTSMGMLLAFRFLAGCAGAAPLAVGGGTIADMISPEERGKYMALFSVGALIGPVLGPVAGGFLTEAAGWRWTFWLMVIIAGCITVLSFVILDETYAPVILKAKAKKFHPTDKSGKETREVAKNDTSGSNLQISRTVLRPLRLLACCPIALALASYLSLIYGYMYLLFTTFTPVFEEGYHFGIGTAGLSYLGLGIGTVIGVIVNGYASDKLMARSDKGDGPKPERRLILMLCTAPFVPAGLFWYGWTAQAHVHWIVPIIGTGFLGFGMLSASLPAQIYVIDCYTEYAASALAATTFLRSLTGSLLPLAGRPLYNALGMGWGNSLLAFVALGGCLAPPIFIRYGPFLREKYPFKG